MNRWGNSRNSVRLYLRGSKITADGDCSHEIKRCLLLGRNVMTNLDSILKSRDITLPTKVCLVKVMVFPVVMWVWVNSGSWWWTGKPGVLRFMGLQSRTQLSDWTELKWMRGLVYLPQLRQSLLETKHQLGFLNELQSPWFSYSQLPATQNLIVHAPQLGSEPGASNDFLQSFMIGLLPWDLDQADEKWAQDYLETVHI